MKKKDILIVAIASIVIIGAVILLIRIVNPTTKTQRGQTEADAIKTVPVEFDENTLNRIKSLSDYGNPTLENIGKTDIFSGF
jgi:flagellar basal body-associated protein FliL